MAGQRINVTVCNLGGVSDSVVSAAKAETELAYLPARVRIVWRACDALPASASQARVPWFVIRLRNDGPPAAAGPASLAVMGKAFVDARGGAVADAYFPAIRATAEQRHADEGVLLGFVMAHELGHLLLGPGHTPDGLMQAAWGQKEIEALRQRRLRFTGDGAERIRRALAARTAASHHWTLGNE